MTTRTATDLATIIDAAVSRWLDFMQRHGGNLPRLTKLPPGKDVIDQLMGNGTGKQNLPLPLVSELVDLLISGQTDVLGSLVLMEGYSSKRMGGKCVGSGDSVRYEESKLKQIVQLIRSVRSVIVEMGGAQLADGTTMRCVPKSTAGARRCLLALALGRLVTSEIPIVREPEQPEEHGLLRLPLAFS